MCLLFSLMTHLALQNSKEINKMKIKGFTNSKQIQEAASGKAFYFTLYPGEGFQIEVDLKYVVSRDGTTVFFAQLPKEELPADGIR
jgi:hypothetical protein